MLRPSVTEVAPERGVDTVLVKDNKFTPRVIEVAAGTEVTWSFEDGRLHDVAGEGWGSERMTSGTFVHTFDAPGTYDYRCTLHGNMSGRVIVTGAV